MKVEMEVWEVEAAKILGATSSQIRNMNRDELYNLLEVTDKSLKKYYHYLDQHLKFPFRASFDQEIGPLRMKTHDVNCIRLDRDMEYEQFYGIFVECREGRKKVMPALAELNVDLEDENHELIEIYQDWFWAYR